MLCVLCLAPGCVYIPVTVEADAAIEAPLASNNSLAPAQDSCNREELQVQLAAFEQRLQESIDAISETVNVNGGNEGNEAALEVLLALEESSLTISDSLVELANAQAEGQTELSLAIEGLFEQLETLTFQFESLQAVAIGLLPPPDSDKDGLPDEDDTCPDMPGFEPVLQGCPDDGLDGLQIESVSVDRETVEILLDFSAVQGVVATEPAEVGVLIDGFELDEADSAEDLQYGETFIEIDGLSVVIIVTRERYEDDLKYEAVVEVFAVFISSDVVHAGINGLDPSGSWPLPPSP